MKDEHLKIIQMALDQADVQMSQCLRLLEGDEEFKAALERVRQAQVLSGAKRQCGTEKMGQVQQ